MSGSGATVEKQTSIELNDIFLSGPEQQYSRMIYLDETSAEAAMTLLQPDESVHRMRVAEHEHAVNRALLRNKGRVDANSSAEPLYGLGHNHFETACGRLESKIRKFLSYSKGWDGDDAEEIPFNAIYASLNFLDEVKNQLTEKEPRDASPSPDGEVVLYWHGPDAYAELNFDGEGVCTLCWSGKEKQVQMIEEKYEGAVEASKGAIWTTLSELVERDF